MRSLKTTPDLSVFDADGVLQYRAPDAGCDDRTLDAVWLRDALDAILDGVKPELPETKPIGCTIKRKP